MGFKFEYSRAKMVPPRAALNRPLADRLAGPPGCPYLPVTPSVASPRLQSPSTPHSPPPPPSQHPMPVKSDRWIRRMAPRTRNDRTLRERPGQKRQHLLRTLFIRIRHPRGARIQGLHERPQPGGRSEVLRRALVRGREGPRVHPSRPIPSRWPAPWSTSASPATCSCFAWARAPMRAAGSS